MPHLDDIRCKHCNALVALIARASIVGRTPLECQNCKVIFVVWPIERQALIIRKTDYQPSQ